MAVIIYARLSQLTRIPVKKWESSSQVNLNLSLFHKLNRRILFFLEKKEKAVELYKLGIEEFLSGLSIRFDNVNELEKYQRIQEKMETNMMMAIERVGVLSKSTKFIKIHQCYHEFLLIFLNLDLLP